MARGEWLARDVLDGMRGRPGRTALAFLAIAVGVSALVAVAAVLDGLGEQSRRMASELGADVVAVVRQPGAAGKAGGLEERHASLLARNLPGHVVSTVRRWEVAVPGAEKAVSVVATDAEIFRVRRWRILDGRPLDATDVEKRERHAVVGSALAARPGFRPGGVVRLGRVPFSIVGVAEIGGGALDAESAGVSLGERVVLVPRTVAPYWLSGEASPGPEVDAIFVAVPPSSTVGAAVSTARSLLSQPDQRVAGISFVTPETLVRGVDRLRRTIQLTAGAISVFCLVLGGTTLMSLMIANVRDRVVEIGLRRALGASRRDIVALFVLEGCLVSAAAAVAGSATAHLALAWNREAFPVPLGLGWPSAAVPLAVALSLGLAFSWWPAAQAAAVEPCEALRND